MNPFIENLIAPFPRLTGPMAFRFVMQPLVALCLGIRDGLKDSKSGTPPFIFDLVFTPKNRALQLKSAWKTLMIPIFVGVALDAVAQYLIFRSVRLIPAIIVGTLIMGIPYSLARAAANRLASMRKKTQPSLNDSPLGK